MRTELSTRGSRGGVTMKISSRGAEMLAGWTRRGVYRGMLAGGSRRGALR